LASTPIIKTHFLVIDLEMTGLDPTTHEIVEVAAVPMTGAEIGGDNAFYSEVRPERTVPAETKAVHGLRGRGLSSAPPIENVLPQFLKMFHKRVIVAHNAAVDVAFLREKARVAGTMPPSRPALDTMNLARALFLGRKGLSLDELLAEFGLKRKGGNHNALDDAILTARVFSKMLLTLKSEGKALNTNELLRIGGI